MNKAKAWKKIRRKLSRADTCPFCGSVPKFRVYCDERMSERGSFGHYAVREPCCKATGGGQTELFFTNNHQPPNFYLWWRMACRLVNDWNQRADPKPTPMFVPQQPDGDWWK